MYIPKFERYEVRRSGSMLNPACIDAKPGDRVELGETQAFKDKIICHHEKTGTALEELEKSESVTRPSAKKRG